MKRSPAIAVLLVTLVASHLACQSEPPEAAEISTSSRSLLVSPSFLAIRVNDVSASSEWYQRVFGLELINLLEVKDRGLTIQILSADGLTVELIEQRGVDRPLDPITTGLFKAGLFVSDINRFHQILADLEVDVDEQIFTDEALNARSFVFRDLEGNRLQAFQPCNGPCL